VITSSVLVNAAQKILLLLLCSNAQLAYTVRQGAVSSIALLGHHRWQDQQHPQIASPLQARVKYYEICLFGGG
jgi:hypothetical protein